MTAAKLFRELFSKGNLTKTYVEHISMTGAVGIDRIRPSAFNARLDVEIDVVVRKINSGCYVFTSFKEKLISKGAGKLPRVISIPTVRDRIVLRALCDLLSRTFHQMKLEIPQIKVDLLCKALATGTYDEFVKIDVESFYPSIQHNRLLKVIRRKIRKPEILAIINRAVATPTTSGAAGHKVKKNFTGVPQGLAISNILAEIYLVDFDKEMAKEPGVFYQRYVDDILILCPAGRAESLATQATASLKNLGLKAHPVGEEKSKSKIGMLHDEFEYLGYKITGPKVSVRKSSIYKFETAIARILTAYRYKLLQAKVPAEANRAREICEWRLNLRITGCIYQDKRLGWVFYFSQINDTSALRALDNTVAELVDRFGLKHKIRVKRLLKAYYEASRKNKMTHRYIINFDQMSVVQKREVLMRYLGFKDIAHLSDEVIIRFFDMRIAAIVKELEEDLAAVS